MLKSSGDTIPIVRAAARPDLGSSTVIIGPMFAGKTSRVISIAEKFKLANYRCVIIKYDKDTRYSVDTVITHKGVSTHIPVVSTGLLCDVDCTEYDVIGIDEGQFYKDIIEFVRLMVQQGKIVVTAYLDSTFEMKPFGPIGELIAMSEYVEKLSAVCMNCRSREAHFSQRIVSSTVVEDIGGAEKYHAVCRNCFVEAKLPARAP